MKILWILLAVSMAALLVVAPNGLWLMRSSAMVRNTGAQAMTLRIVIIDETDRIIEVGELAPGARVSAEVPGLHRIAKRRGAHGTTVRGEAIVL